MQILAPRTPPEPPPQDLKYLNYDNYVKYLNFLPDPPPPGNPNRVYLEAASWGSRVVFPYEYTQGSFQIDRRCGLQNPNV